MLEFGNNTIWTHIISYSRRYPRRRRFILCLFVGITWGSWNHQYSSASIHCVSSVQRAVNHLPGFYPEIRKIKKNISSDKFKALVDLSTFKTKFPSLLSTCILLQNNSWVIQWCFFCRSIIIFMLMIFSKIELTFTKLFQNCQNTFRSSSDAVFKCKIWAKWSLFTIRRVSWVGTWLTAHRPLDIGELREEGLASIHALDHRQLEIEGIFRFRQKTLYNEVSKAYNLAPPDLKLSDHSLEWWPIVFGPTVSQPTVWGPAVFGAYILYSFGPHSLGTDSLAPSDSKLSDQAPEWAPTVWDLKSGAYNVGAYSLGAYSLTPPDSKQSDHSLDWSLQSRVPVSRHQIWSCQTTHQNGSLHAGALQSGGLQSRATRFEAVRPFTRMGAYSLGADGLVAYSLGGLQSGGLQSRAIRLEAVRPFPRMRSYGLGAYSLGIPPTVLWPTV